MADSVSELMQQAIARHGRGALDDASRLHNHVLRREPEHSYALHLPGVVAHQHGRDEDAVTLISRPIARSPAAPAFRNNLGMVLTALGRTKEAETAYQEALALAPDFPDAMLNLGNLRAGSGRLEEALTLREKRDSSFWASSWPSPRWSQGIRREHGNAKLTELTAWDAYERGHPERFRSMCHFWCRKPDA